MTPTNVGTMLELLEQFQPPSPPRYLKSQKNNNKVPGQSLASFRRREAATLNHVGTVPTVPTPSAAGDASP